MTGLVISAEACNPYGLMTTTLKWTKRIALSILAVIAIAALVWTISRALYPTAEQRDALAVMQLPAPPDGSNAFASLWTLDRAVPSDKVEEVLRQDAARIAEMPQFPDPDGPAAGFVSAADRFPDLAPSPQDRELFCSRESEQCLEKVAGDPSTYRALVERNRELLDRIEALSRHDFVRQQLPWHMSASIIVPGHAGLTATRHALWFAEGRLDDALAASCRGMATWRRLGASGDTLVLRLIANAFAIEYHGGLLADMLVELPVDYPLPPACKPALAPPSPQELSLCTAMRGEFELFTETTGPMLDEINDWNWWSSLMFFLAYDAEATAAARAQNLAPICAERELARIAADRPEVEPRKVPGIWRPACLGNFIGCTMTSSGPSPYASYRIRMQDFGARLKLLATLAWLRDNADHESRLESLLAARPQSLKSPTREITVTDDGALLQIRMFDDRRGSNRSILLPRELR